MAHSRIKCLFVYTDQYKIGCAYIYCIILIGRGHVSSRLAPPFSGFLPFFLPSLLDPGHQSVGHHPELQLKHGIGGLTLVLIYYELNERT